ncbi:MAG: hypothetical protein ACYDAD_05505 [Acidimicrobiales bacterium]
MSRGGSGSGSGGNRRWDGMGSEPGMEYEVFQDVAILAVEEIGEELVVDLYGGDGSVCGSVTYEIGEADLRARRAETLRGWCERAVPLTYVRRGGSVALMDEAALFADSFEE